MLRLSDNRQTPHFAPDNMRQCLTIVNTTPTNGYMSMSAKGKRQVLSDWLAEGMRLRGWSQTQTSQESDVSRDTIWRILEGKVDPNQATLGRLEQALNHPLPALAIVSEEGLILSRSGIASFAEAAIEELKATAVEGKVDLRDSVGFLRVIARVAREVEGQKPSSESANSQ